jgi:hypothetical protein
MAQTFLKFRRNQESLQTDDNTLRREFQQQRITSQQVNYQARPLFAQPEHHRLKGLVACKVIERIEPEIKKLTRKLQDVVEKAFDCTDDVERNKLIGSQKRIKSEIDALRVPFLEARKDAHFHIQASSILICKPLCLDVTLGLPAELGTLIHSSLYLHRWEKRVHVIGEQLTRLELDQHEVCLAPNDKLWDQLFWDEHGFPELFVEEVIKCLYKESAFVLDHFCLIKPFLRGNFFRKIDSFGEEILPKNHPKESPQRHHCHDPERRILGTLGSHPPHQESRLPV